MSNVLKKGIDISTWQGDVNFSKIKTAGVDYVIIRAGYSQNIDKWFESNYKKAKSAGVPIGAYWYSEALTEAAVKAEAQACIKALTGKTFEYPIYLDLEESKQFAKGKIFCSSIINAFCSALLTAGFYPGLYMSKSPLTSYVDDSTQVKYPVWVAQYNSSCTYNKGYGMWQYSSTGSVNGIIGNVDMDYCYVDYPAVIKNGGYNGYEKTTTPASGSTKSTTTPTSAKNTTPSSKVTTTSSGTAKKTIAEIAQEVIDGKWGDGTTRKAKLTAAGYEYAVVQAKVNEVLNSKSNIRTVDEIAKEVVVGKWGNGTTRKKKLEAAGYDYTEVQKAVNKLLS